MFTRLRSTHRVRQILATWLLAWLGMIALPVFGAPTGAWVCHGAGGVKLVFVKLAPQAPGEAHKALQDTPNESQNPCPLCAGAALPAPPGSGQSVEPERLGHVLQAAIEAHLKRLASAHFIARGPPAA